MTNILLLHESITNGYKAEFLLFLSIICIFFGISVIITKNPILSVLFLIGLFFSISIYLMMLGLYFIGLSYLLVYVGAVSILFFFILTFKTNNLSLVMFAFFSLFSLDEKKYEFEDKSNLKLIPLESSTLIFSDIYSIANEVIPVLLAEGSNYINNNYINPISNFYAGFKDFIVNIDIERGLPVNSKLNIAYDHTVDFSNRLINNLHFSRDQVPSSFSSITYQLGHGFTNRELTIQYNLLQKVYYLILHYPHFIVLPFLSIVVGFFSSIFNNKRYSHNRASPEGSMETRRYLKQLWEKKDEERMADRLNNRYSDTTSVPEKKSDVGAAGEGDGNQGDDDKKKDKNKRKEDKKKLENLYRKLKAIRILLLELRNNFMLQVNRGQPRFTPRGILNIFRDLRLLHQELITIYPIMHTISNLPPINVEFLNRQQLGTYNMYSELTSFLNLMDMMLWYINQEHTVDDEDMILIRNYIDTQLVNIREGIRVFMTNLKEYFKLF